MSFLIRALVAGSPEDGLLRKWLRGGQSLGASTIVWAEFHCGPVKEAQKELAGRVVIRRLPFTEDHATAAADLFNEGGRRRGSLVDCMIAATALGAGAPLATSNPADFERFSRAGLSLVGAES